MKTYVLSDPKLIHQKLTIYQHSSCTEVATLRMFLSKYFQIRKVQVVVMSVITATAVPCQGCLHTLQPCRVRTVVCAEVFAFILIICVHSQCHTVAFQEASGVGLVTELRSRVLKPKGEKLKPRICFEVYLHLLSSIQICLSIVPCHTVKSRKQQTYSQFILSIYCFLLIIVVLSAVCLWRSRQRPLLRGTLIDLQVCWRGLHGLQDTWPRGLGCSG